MSLPSIVPSGRVEPDDLLLAVPKKGRLHKRIMEILDGAGLKHVRANRLDVARCSKQPVTIVFLPAADIAKFVMEGNVDLGITGEDIIAESDAEAHAEILMRLGMGKCRLCVQAPVGTVKDPVELCGKRIVTSFPNLASAFFHQLCPDKDTKIRFVTGSVEAACGLGLADAVVDLVETGTTMRAAGLEVVAEVMKTETVLICNPKSRDKPMVKRIFQRIKGYVTATQNAMLSYNVEVDKLKDAVKITPGHESATITPLQDPAWKSVSALVKKSEISDLLDQLIEIGAKSAVVVDVSNCRFE